MQTTSTNDVTLSNSIEDGRLPGVVALASYAGRLQYSRAFGKRNVSDGPAMSLDSIFWIASMTKPITSVAAMQLVERGKVDLDTPIARIVPGLESPKVLEGFDDNGDARLRPAKRAITLRHLLTHSSGLGYEMCNHDIVRYNEVTGSASILTLQRAALDAPLTFDPGDA